MPDIHKSLAECQETCEALVKEIAAYKQARELEQDATSALESMAATLQDTAASIKPFTEVRFRRFRAIVLGVTILNCLLLGAAVVLLWLRN